MENQDSIVAAEISTFLVHAGVRFVKRHYISSTLWVLGLVVMATVNGFAVSPEAANKYDMELQGTDPMRITRAERDLRIAQQEYADSGSGFLYLSCDDYCMRKYQQVQDKRMILDMYKLEDEEKLSKARSHVGIFSEYAVSDARQLFWGILGKGKEIAQRSSYYDLIFMGIGSIGRDESLASFAIRWIFQMAINFTISLIGAFIAFVYYVGGLIASYQADPISGIVFYFLAVVSAGSFIVSYVVALYAAAAGTVYVVAKAAGPNLRIAAGNEYRRRQFIHAGGDGHHRE